jgi:tRNA uridine 5-carboxymethylaminomethyl modification enzyme
VFHVKQARSFDVVVIGGGHAGCEAAAAAARLGATTALITQSRQAIGAMSCNPAIGGIGKGQIVREIDALDGLMARAIDASGIHFRMLNQSKGPAVRGPRAQADRARYAAAMQLLLATTANLTIVEATVDDLVRDAAGRVTGVTLADGHRIAAAAVVLTTGTFLRGVIHLGEQRLPAGRVGAARSCGLSYTLRRLRLRLGRLKTGTPPRLHGPSIDWAALTPQASDDPPTPFSFLTRRITTPQIACHLTATTPATHALIRANLDRAPLYSGQIRSSGPRYCPSIEDKVVRFADRSRHGIFLEPEGLDDHTVYPNGISTSLPLDVQHRLVATIPGLQRARILRPGYAIEYDFVDPRQLTPALELISVPRLFLAGQINGTTGYEEAAGQGIVAGINAARAAAGTTPFVISRSEGYIGVMIDDLVSLGTDEPYRMFTARAEFRLSLRADNADQRLTPRGRSLGVVGAERAAAYAAKAAAIDRGRELLERLSAGPAALLAHGIAVNRDGERRSAYRLLGYPGVTIAGLSRFWPELAVIEPAAAEQLANDAHYQGYLARQEADRRALQRDETLALPPDLDYAALPGLSNELRSKLTASRPATLAAAMRLPGMTPAAMAVLLARVRREPMAAENAPA